jgi:regulator of sirC expression with transglutaminase-like and TPR domain
MTTQQKTKHKRLTEKDFRILLTFLTEKNEGTLSLVRNQIKESLQKHPRYLDILPSVKDPKVRGKASDLFEEWRFEKLQPSFEKLFQKGENLDLERGLYLLASLEYPRLKIKDVSSVLDMMAEDVNRLIAKEKPMPTKSVFAMRKYLFEIQGFNGNEQNYYDPENLFINKVLENKAGMPITLSCIYLFVGWRLRMPVHGVGLPGHFVVGHRIPRGVTYIDPFNDGRILRAKDCEVFVKRLGLAFRHEFLDPMPNLQILSRMIVNLINVFNDQGNTTRAQMLAQLFQLVQ